jgi:hypothetical protein
MSGLEITPLPIKVISKLKSVKPKEPKEEA